MNVKEQVLTVLEDQKGDYISGSRLAQELQVSRNAVWKAVKSLQEEGYSIETGTNRGYRLCPENDLLSVQSISKYLLPEYRGLTLEVYKTITSTNTKLKEYAAEGRPEIQILVAEEQTEGRGRMGRSFYSPNATGVYISFLFRPKFTAEESLYLTTAAAVAAAETIDEVIDASAEHAVIKWVNDVFYREKKVCGILTEASVNVENSMLEYAITGIGFNVYEPDCGFPEELREIAGSIFGRKETVFANQASSPETAIDIRSRIVAGMINHFLAYYEHLTERSFMAEYKKRSFLLGKQVQTIAGTPMTGTAVDIDDAGHLILELADGSRHSLSSGEVRVRPVN